MDKPKQTGKKKATKSQLQSKAETQDFMDVGGSPVPGLTLRCILLSQEATFRGIVWSPDGLRLVLPSTGKTIGIWDSEQGECLVVLEHGGMEARSAIWSSDGEMLATSFGDTIQLRNG